LYTNAVLVLVQDHLGDIPGDTDGELDDVPSQSALQAERSVSSSRTPIKPPRRAGLEQEVPSLAQLAPQLKKRPQPTYVESIDGSDSSDSDEPNMPIETLPSSTFLINDKEAVKQYVRLRLSEMNGVFLKELVHRWLKLLPGWKSKDQKFQVDKKRQEPPPTWPEGVSFNGVHHLRKEGMSNLTLAYPSPYPSCCETQSALMRSFSVLIKPSVARTVPIGFRTPNVWNPNSLILTSQNSVSIVVV